MLPAPASPVKRSAALRLALAWTVTVLALNTTQAAPFIPASDSEVVEKLPQAGNPDPLLRRVQSMRQQLAARPNDDALRLELGRRYFDLAQAQGDPRYVGYAEAAITPLGHRPAPTADYWLLHGLLRQYGHDFDGALRSLERASDLAPGLAEPVAWRAAIHMVQARYAEARSECERLATRALPLQVSGCLAYVQAATGGLAAAYQTLEAASRQGWVEAPAGLRLWVLTRLAEMAWRLGRTEQAERHFQQALQLGITDQFLLAAYADFLLAGQRWADTIHLLANWERADPLLLRLALAGRPMKHPRAADWTEQLRERFASARQRGDRLHEQELARFELDIGHDPRAALAAAQHNYTLQKEPRDAEILLRCALATGDSAAAQPVLRWLQASHYEDPRLQDLVARLPAANGERP